MITETGKVVAVHGDQIWVQTIQTSACQRCSARAGCGQRALAAVSGGRANQILVENTAAARVGDEVVIGLDEQSLLTASLAVYGLPLILMLIFSGVVHQGFGASEPMTILAALVGLGSGFGLVRWQRIGSSDRFQPTLLRVNRTVTVQCL
ncbi:MAG: sigma E positive regulator RseC/MucC [Marinobacter sp. 34-60-7]|nr:MAG: sigma E positive regulator RseC/MucC [Marinobacter sp. 34-60-7]